MVRWNEVVAATEVLWRHCFTETRLEYSENIAKDTFCSRGKGNEKAARFDFLVFEALEREFGAKVGINEYINVK